MPDLVIELIGSWGLLGFVHSASFAPFRIALGFVVVLFLPGYALLAALYPRAQELAFQERVILSLGLSIVVTTITGVLLSFTPWGIDGDSVAGSLAILVGLCFLCAVFLRLRQRRGSVIGALAQSSLSPQVVSARGGLSCFHLGLIGLGVMTVGLFALFVYRQQQLPPKQLFAEFAVLDASGRAEEYATRLSVGKPAAYVLSVVNNERGPVEYVIQAWLLEKMEGQIGPFTLQPGERREQAFRLTPQRPTTQAWLEFQLFREKEHSPSQKVGIWVKVVEVISKPSGE